METITSKQLAGILKTYLLEFCEVNEVNEKQLRKHVIAYSNPEDGFAAILSAKNREVVKIGVKMTDEGFEISGEYNDKSDDFPKTKEYIASLNG